MLNTFRAGSHEPLSYCLQIQGFKHVYESTTATRFQQFLSRAELPPFFRSEHVHAYDYPNESFIPHLFSRRNPAIFPRTRSSHLARYCWRDNHRLRVCLVAGFSVFSASSTPSTPFPHSPFNREIRSRLLPHFP